jgi:hypothetical protein
MVKCAIYQASKSIFDRTLFIRVSFRTCVCLVWREKGEKTKDMSGRVGSVAGTSSDMSFGADQTVVVVVVSVRPSVVSLACCREAGGDRGAGRDITTRQDRDEER